MRTYDEAYEAALDRRPFSNGTEGHAWMDNWCYDGCVNDSPELVDQGKGCPLIMVALMGRTPVEWIDQTENGTNYLGDTYHCTEYREEDEGGGDDETPPPPTFDPEMPGQTTIFEVFADKAADELTKPAGVAA